MAPNPPRGGDAPQTAAKPAPPPTMHAAAPMLQTSVFEVRERDAIARKLTALSKQIREDPDSERVQKLCRPSETDRVFVSESLHLGDMRLRSVDDRVQDAMDGILGMSRPNSPNGRVQSMPNVVGAQDTKYRRGEFSVTNRSNVPVRVSVHVVPGGAEEASQFSVAGGAEPRELRPKETTKIDIKCSAALRPGMNAVWVMFIVEYPIRGDMLRWTVEKQILVRRASVSNVYSLKRVRLDVQAKSWYPRSLVTLFDRPVAVVHVGPLAGISEVYEGVSPSIPPEKPIVASVTSKLLNHLHKERLSNRRASEKYTKFASHQVDQWQGRKRRAMLACAPPVANESAEFKKASSPKSPQRALSLLAGTHLGLLDLLTSIESQRLDIDIRAHDLFHKTLRLVKDSGGGPRLYTIEAPGVGEGRPAVSIGDTVLLRPTCEPLRNFLEVRARIHFVREKSIGISMGDTVRAVAARGGEGWPPLKGAGAGAAERDPLERRSWHARFVVNKRPFRIMQCAVQHFRRRIDRIWHLIMPPPPQQGPQPPRKYDTFDPIGRGRALNGPQVKAIQDIRNRTNSDDGPYIVFGPPGTGKTTTVIEAILQVLRDQPHAQILVCTPSNYSADILVSRLGRADADLSMLRLNAPTRYQEASDALVKRYFSVDSETGFFTTPTLDELKTYRVIVSTCVTAYSLVERGMQPGTITHFFFDESSQAMEPELLVPLILADRKSVVVLAGDHQQLGAIVHCPLVANNGLKVSLQERLLNGWAQYSGRNSRVMTKLLCNYRSHPKLLSVFSQLFYRGELVPCGAKEITHSLVDWKMLPNQTGCPCLFYGLVGNDVYVPESGSVCNRHEAETVLELTQRLLKDRSELSTDSIGVIAPYRMQVILIRKLFRAAGLGAVRVGTVEDFQGKEERVIIISTVISSSSRAFESARNDKSGLGIFSNPKRFNVAISRAQALMIIVGNPVILLRLKWWKHIVKFCMRNKVYTGVESSVDFMDMVGDRVLSLGSGKSIESKDWVNTPSDIDRYYGVAPGDIAWRVMS